MSSMEENDHGFALIELLVVIAIIGVLSSLVIATTLSARNKAADARIKNDVRQLRWLAEIVYNSQNNDFTDWSIHPQVIDDLNLLVTDINEAHQTIVTISIGDQDNQSFCVSAPMKSNTSRHYCIDASREIHLTDNPCPSATAPHVCP